jgi:AcrR family transcriptional regulator
MPYSLQHRSDTRRRILESARRLFNRKGFSEVSIDEIMSDAGLTHGGFYRQFLCKEAPEAWQAKQAGSAGAGKTRARRIIDAYFSRDHFDDRESCCPLLGMASDVSRSGEPVKAAYREVAEMMVGIFAASLGESQARERALVLVALCVGGMVLARGLDDPDLADDFRNAAHKHVLRIAGWRGAKEG